MPVASRRAPWPWWPLCWPSAARGAERSPARAPALTTTSRAVGVTTSGGGSPCFAAASLTERSRHSARSSSPGTPAARSHSASCRSELVSQIQGAPADVFASATRPRCAAHRGRRRRSPPRCSSATGLVIAVQPATPRGSPGWRTSPTVLDGRAVRGRRCRAAPRRTRFWDAGRPGPGHPRADVKATLAKVALGEVDAAIVYKTDMQAAGDKVEGIDHPGRHQRRRRYPIAVVKATGTPRPAGVRHPVRSAGGASVLTAAGFDAP